MTLSPIWVQDTPLVAMTDVALRLLRAPQSPSVDDVRNAIDEAWGLVAHWFDGLPPAGDGADGRALPFVSVRAGTAAAAAAPVATIEHDAQSGLLRGTIRTVGALPGGVERPLRVVSVGHYSAQALRARLLTLRGLRGPSATTAAPPPGLGPVACQAHVDLDAAALLAVHALQATLSTMDAVAYAERIAALLHEVPAILGHTGVVLDEGRDGGPSASQNAVGAAPGWGATADQGALALELTLSVRVPEEDDPLQLRLRSSLSAQRINDMRNALRGWFTGADATNGELSGHWLVQLTAIIAATAHDDANEAWDISLGALDGLTRGLKRDLRVISCAAEQEPLLDLRATEISAPPGQTGPAQQLTASCEAQVAGLGTCGLTAAVALSQGDFEERRQALLGWTRGA